MISIMKRIFTALISLSLIQHIVFANVYQQMQENPDTSDWITWKNPSAERLQGSAMDASFVLDSPAGKHGFISVSGENMYFDDGTQARFWGTNVCATSNFNSHEDAQMLAARIAQQGFNLVRFHQLDVGGSQNIFSEGIVSSTLQLDSAQLDKLFYFMAELKKRGVYFYVDTIDYRTTAPEDGIADKNNGIGWQKEGYFDPDLIQLQKDYIAQLFTTVNPYTGLSLAADPAFVLTSVQNETNFFTIQAGEFTGKYAAEFTALFNEWLKNKYSGDDQLRAAWYQAGKYGLAQEESLSDNSVNILGNSTHGIPEIYTALNYSDLRTKDASLFLYDTAKSYYTQMIGYIRSLNTRCLITSVSLSKLSNMSLNKELMDFTDMHTYMSHPTQSYEIGSASWNDSTLKDSFLFSIIANQRVYNQPFFLGEWQECMTNGYHGELPLLMASFACYQNWNPIQFCITSKSVELDNGRLECFETYNDPANTVMQTIAALVFHRHEVEEAEAAYYYPYSKEEALVPDSITPWNSYYRYGKIGTAFTEADDYDASKSDPGTLAALRQRFRSDIVLNEQMSINMGGFHPSEMYFKLDTRYTNAIESFEPGKTFDMSRATIKQLSDYANIAITSVSEDTLEASDRILISAVGRARNTDFELTDNVFTNLGTAPVLAEPVDAEITLKTRENITAYALDSDGKRKAILPVEKTSGGYSKITIDGKYMALSYEITKNEANYLTLNAQMSGQGFEISGISAAKNVSVMITKPGVQGGVSVGNAAESIYWMGQARTDDTGNYSIAVPVSEQTEKGVYVVTAGALGSASLSASVNFERYNGELITANVSLSEDRARVRGLLYDELGAPRENEPVLIYVTHAGNAYYLYQQKTDSDGRYTFDINLYGADAGSYTVVVSAKRGEADSARANAEFVYEPGMYRLMLFTDKDKSSILYNLHSAQTVTAVALENNALIRGTLCMAFYQDNKLVSIKTEGAALNQSGELYTSMTMPANVANSYVRLFLIKDTVSMQPLTNASEITAE